MATLAELQDALVNADKAGDGAAARQLADAIRALRSPEPPAAVRAGNVLQQIPRQLELTGRYAMEGVPALADMLAAPFRIGLSKLAGRHIPTASEQGSRAANAMGLAQPEGANERVIGDATRMIAGAGGGVAALGRVAGPLAETLAANPGIQGLSAAGAGLAGGAVRESGGGPVAQFVAALGGGVAGGAGAAGANALGSSLAARGRALVSPPPPQIVEQRIELALRGSGLDWSQVPERARQALRAEVEQALKTGDAVSPDAIRRLADFKLTQTTPTRGMLTQDPVQITREMNLAKTGANSTDIGLQRLPGLQSQNTAGLLRNLDDLGAKNAPDSFSAGARLIGGLQGNIDSSKGRIDSLYSAARDSQGRSAPLDGVAFTSKANQLLDEGLLGGALPQSVATHMNRIAKGEVPFDVNYAEQLKTAMGKLQRATSDGQTRMALGVVRSALDDAPLLPMQKINPGNLPMIPGSIPPSMAALGDDAVAAFNRARSANRAFMERVEKTPALKAVLDGAEPDKFVQQFVLSGGASAADVRAMARAIADRPEALDAVKTNIVAHLKAAATNNTDDIAKFSPASYNRALNNIGDRKLASFFGPGEIAQLRAIGRVGTLMKAQPDGSAVNNSNSGALLLGRALTAMDSLAGKLPLGLDTTIQGVLRGQQQSSALNVPAALRLPAAKPQTGLLGQVGISPYLFSGGLLSPPAVD